MIITCENCSTSFNLDEKILKPSGSKVRCSKCKHLFVAYPPAPPEPEKEIPEEKTFVEASEEAAAGGAFVPDSQGEGDQESMAPETTAAGVTDESLTAGAESVSIAEDEDLSEDLDVELDIDTVAEGKDILESEIPESVEEDLDSPDIEEEAPLQETDEAVTEKAVESEELDLDLDLDMEPEPEAAKEAGAGEAVESEELDLDLDLDMEPEPEAVEEAGIEEAVESGELDFSDFEETVMLDSPPFPDTDMKSEDLTEDLDLDLDLDLGMEEESELDLEPDMPAVDERQAADLEDLDLEMDLEMDFEMESGDEESVDVLEEDEAEDIDLSDIEKMLDADAEPAEAAGTELELDEADAEVEKWAQRPEQDGTMDETAEIDLSNIVLDTEGVEEEEAEDVELELDINEGPDEKDAGAIDEPLKDSSDIDISEFEDFEIPDEQELAGESFTGGDIDLEFEMEGEKTPEGVQAFDSGAEAETVAYGAPFVGSGEPAGETKKKKAKKIKPYRKSSIAKPILVVLVLLVLAFATVIILDRIDIQIPMVSDYVKQVPYINQLMKPDAKQTGEISILNITSHFVDNAKHGKFFVIRGTAKNEFPESRRYLKLTGTLFRTGKAVVQQESVYCGNVQSNKNLASMDLAEIKEKLSNRFGDNKTNFEVKPGQEIPFMIVFSNLPDDLEEFAIEVAGSFPIQQQ